VAGKTRKRVHLLRQAWLERSCADSARGTGRAESESARMNVIGANGDAWRIGDATTRGFRDR
jgi:hypothetical protein